MDAAKDPAQRLKLLQRMEQLDVRRNELLADIVDVIRHELTLFDVDHSAATLVAHAMADRLADFWGGMTISFPRDYQWKLSQRELEIHDMFKGNNWAELIRHSGMTERGLRKMLIRIERKLHR